MITDLNYLKTMSDGDSAFINEMISLFKEQVEEYSALMPTLLDEEKWLDLSKLAHKAKSSVAVMGMKDTANLLKNLEILAREAKNVERYPDMVALFLANCSQAVSELQQSN